MDVLTSALFALGFWMLAKMAVERNMVVFTLQHVQLTYLNALIFALCSFFGVLRELEGFHGVTEHLVMGCALVGAWAALTTLPFFPPITVHHQLHTLQYRCE